MSLTSRYATLPAMYLTSRLFPSVDGAFIAYVSLHFVLGLCTLLMTTMPRLLAVVTGAQVGPDSPDPVTSPPTPVPTQGPGLRCGYQGGHTQSIRPTLTPHVLLTGGMHSCQPSRPEVLAPFCTSSESESPLSPQARPGDSGTFILRIPSSMSPGDT